MGAVEFKLLMRTSGYDSADYDYSKKIPVEYFTKYITQVQEELIELAKTYNKRGITEVATAYKLTAGITSEIVKIITRYKKSIMKTLPYIEDIEFNINDKEYYILITLNSLNGIPLEVMTTLTNLLDKFIRKTEKWGVSEVKFKPWKDSKIIIKIE